MKSLYLQLWQVVAQEWATRCCTSTTRDSQTVSRRFEHEGLAFLAITLPRFCDDFQKSLADGEIDRNAFQGFTWRAGLPTFLSGFLDLVFDRGTGRLLDEPHIDAIHAVRQLTLLYGKIEKACSKARIDHAVDQFIETEQEVKHSDSERTPADYREFTRMSRMLFGGVLTGLDLAVYDHALHPKHGPGATADKLRGNSKWSQLEWPQRLEEAFPSGEYLIPNWRYNLYLDRVHFLPRALERPVKVTLVPKTLKTPRVIAIEPTAMQYMQQAISRDLVEALEGPDNPYRWLLGFSDNEPNQLMAAEGSASGSLATLDLSEASDRVSNQLVRCLLGDHPWLNQGVDACRSRKADVPGHGVIRLAKFASMGSALTFPIEAMVFATVVMLGIEKARNLQLTRKSLMGLKGQVRIFGDDIVVPVDTVESVVSELEAFGFKVNSRKSFWTGSFRESCGKEYYDGHDVSIVRVRAEFPAQRSDIYAFARLTNLRNRFYMKGMWQVAKFLDDRIRPVLRFYPTVSPDSGVVGRWSLLGFDTQKLHKDWQSPLVKGYYLFSDIPESILDDVPALQKILLSKSAATKSPLKELAFNRQLSASRNPGSFPLEEDPFLRLLRGIEPGTDEEHLKRLGRPESVSIKLGWASPLTRGRAE